MRRTSGMPASRAIFTSAVLLLSAVQAEIVIGPLDSPIKYTNATGSSGTTLVPFSVSMNTIPANDWDNITYLNALRSSAWNWGANVSESSGVETADETGTTQSIITLSWPEGDGPESADADHPWSYCALYIPELGDSLFKESKDCDDSGYSDCEKAVIVYLETEKTLTDTHFTCSGQKTIPVPTECKTAFGSNAPSQLTSTY
jgi:hypothetical protein